MAKFNAKFAKLVEFTLSKKIPNLFVENSEISKPRIPSWQLLHVVILKINAKFNQGVSIWILKCTCL